MLKASSSNRLWSCNVVSCALQTGMRNKAFKNIVFCKVKQVVEQA